MRDRLAFGGRHGGARGQGHRDQRLRATARPARRPSVAAGQIGKLWGLADVRIGDAIGDAAGPGDRAASFAPPTLETVVVPGRPADRGALHVALAQLAEQDPLINLRQDDLRQEISVSLYGEVQKEVIQATLADEFGLEVAFRETHHDLHRAAGRHRRGGRAHRPRTPTRSSPPSGCGSSPAPVGTGVTFRLEVELGSMPYAFFTAVEDTVPETLRPGPPRLAGHRLRRSP